MVRDGLLRQTIGFKLNLYKKTTKHMSNFRFSLIRQAASFYKFVLKILAELIYYTLLQAT